jgi:hypothetical protein
VMFVGVKLVEAIASAVDVRCPRWWLVFWGF